MLYYLIAITIFLITLLSPGCITSDKGCCSKARFNKYTPFFLLFLLLGSIKWNTGTDWDSYQTFFINNNSVKDWYAWNYELGFSCFNYIIHKITNSYTFYLFVYTLIIIIIEKRNLTKISVFFGLSLYMYFCTFFGAIFAVRQLLAQAICYLSIDYIHDKKIIKFLLITLIAFLIHRSALIWIIAYFIYNKKITNTAFICIFIVCTIIGLFGNQIYAVLIKTFISPYKNRNILFWRLDSYVFSYTEIYTSSPIKLLASIIKRLIFMPFFLMNRKQIESRGKYVRGILNLYVFGNCCYLLFSTSFIVFQRVLSYFCSFEIYLLPCLIIIFKRKSSKMIFLLLFLAYGLLKLYTQIAQFPGAFIPYKSIFS